MIGARNTEQKKIPTVQVSDTTMFNRITKAGQKKQQLDKVANY